MKTTSKTVLLSKIAKLETPKKGSIARDWLIEIANGKKTIRPVYSQGSSWKHSSLHDRRYEIETPLKKLGIEYQTGNDAPMGGKTGAFLRITTKIYQK